MLSILIPVYNFDICLLVEKIHQQGKEMAIPFEIICVDDASSDEFVQKNKKIENLEFVRLELLQKNKGRSKIRNYMADLAQYSFLLYMDCDSMPPDNDFLKRYISELSPSKLLYGGRTYQPNPPKESNLLLHWHYGIAREVSKAKDRKKSPWHSFMTNNFLIPKAIFLAIKFDENLTEYGHEDTLFGLELKKRNIKIIHLDNPLIHIGLEQTAIFLEKTEKAIKNLHYLHLKYALGKEIRLLKYSLGINRWRLGGIYLFVYRLAQKKIIKNLYSIKPNLYFFDLFKLAKLLEQNKLK